MFSKHLVLFAFALLLTCLAVENWSQTGRDAQNSRRTSFTFSAPSSWQISIPDVDFVTGGFTEPNNYFAVDGDSGTLYVSLTATNWATSSVYSIGLQDGGIKNSFTFETRCDFQKCPFSLAFSKNNILSKTGDVLCQYAAKKGPSAPHIMGLAGFSLAPTGKIAWTFENDPATIGSSEVQEPNAITSEDVIIVSQYTSVGYSVAGVQYLQKGSAPLWVAPFDQSVASPSVDANDNVYVNYNSTNIVRIDGATGHIISMTEAIPTEYFPNYDMKPAVGNKRVYAVSRNGTSSFSAVAFTNDEDLGFNQKLLWSTPLTVTPNPASQTPYPYYCSPVVVSPNTQGHNGDETIFVNCYHPNGTIAILYAFNAENGKQLWSTEVGRAPATYLVCNSVALSNGGKYLAIDCLQYIKGNSQIVVLETTTGKVVNTIVREKTYRSFMFLDQDDYFYYAYSVTDSQTQRRSVKIEKGHLLRTNH